MRSRRPLRYGVKHYIFERKMRRTQRARHCPRKRTPFRARRGRQCTRVCIPAKRNRRRPVAFHRGYYQCRHRVENFICRIKRHRRISTRYENLAATFLGFAQLAAVLDWLTHRF